MARRKNGRKKGHKKAAPEPTPKTTTLPMYDGANGEYPEYYGIPVPSRSPTSKF